MPPRITPTRGISERVASGRGARVPLVTGTGGAPPEALRRELRSVLIPASRIRSRVGELGRRISADYAGRELVVVGLMNGTVVFLSDLIRQIRLPLSLEFLRATSYRDSTRPGLLTITRTPPVELGGRHVLVVDDILDTGRTLDTVLRRLRRLGPASLRTCVLLDKPERRERPAIADYVGFRIPDVFVVGYGLDLAGRHRNLPYVAIAIPPSGSGGRV
ncbi:MAG: hypoxanthine phosphoribosyltransferase [Verrucomicrobiae bacterium]|nr:hypoxanthine phosphoribosyltransferase [Verrucomicrobiae bacterium]